MDNNYLSLFSFLLSDSKRLQLSPIMNKLVLDYPYDMLWEEMKKLKEVPNSAPKNVTNALFVGSTAELQKMLKGKE